MKTSFSRRFSVRQSLLTAALCLCALLPGQGGARSMAGPAHPAATVSAATVSEAPRSQEEGEVGVISSPGSYTFGYLYEGGHNYNQLYFGWSNFSGEMAVRVQLEDASDAANFDFRFGTDETLPAQSLEEGGFWVPDEQLRKLENGEALLESLFIWGKNACTMSYTVSVYASRDLTSQVLCASSRTIRFVPGDQMPRISDVERISGELNTDIPFTFNVSRAGFLQGEPARIEIYLRGSYDGLTLSGPALEKDTVNTNVYVLSIPAFSATKYTLTARATEACSGTYELRVYDGEGHSVTYGGDAVFTIPMEYSQEDIAALRAIADANPLSTDLKNFIANGDYLKDHTEEGYNVGVTWNTETPSRVSRFFISDDRTNTVSALDLSGLSALEDLRLSGTRLSSLDLSALTKLSHLQLYGNNALTWSSVKLPNPLPANFRAYGETYVSAGTPLDDYNAYAAAGTEIDLSAYAEVSGVKSVYQWYLLDKDNGRNTEVTMEAVSGKEGAFILRGNPGAYYYCEITNENYREWRMRTPVIKVSRGSDSYSPADIAALKKLAADNPSVTQLQEFVDSKGWENENWDAYQDVIRTNWNTDEIGRLTHLAIELTWDSEDTISSLDLSAFTELRYFECERFMNITKLDLSKNTKLEELHVYSRNLPSLDLSNCPELRYLRFGMQTRSWSRYQPTLLTELNLTGCTRLSELYLENTPLASLDISSFKNLSRLELEHCPNLSLKGFDSATQLEYLALPHTSQFGDLIQDLPASIRHLYLQDTEYELPSAQSAKNLQTLGIPEHVESLDLALYPNLLNLRTDGSRLRYSTVKNYRQMNYYGNGSYELTSPSHPDDPRWFENGDTINLSSEAVIDGVESVFLWVNGKYGTEEKEAFKEVPGRPGVFVLDSKEEQYGDYWCKIMNPKFCKVTEINYYSGWQITTSRILVETSVPQVFAESDVAVLARIVGESNHQALTDWWSSGAWKTGEISENAQAVWNDENPRRLTELYLNQMGNSFAQEVDLSNLDKLEILSLAGSYVHELTLPKNNTVLRDLRLGHNPALESLIVAACPSLAYLDVSHTGLTALDLSNNKSLTSLFLNGTDIAAADEETAARLTGYGVPMSATRIDLAKFPELKVLRVDGSRLEFAGVENPRQLESALGTVLLPVGDARPGGPSVGFAAYGETIDLSAQQAVGVSESRFAWRLNGDSIDHAESRYTVTEALDPNDELLATVTNPLFPGWLIDYRTTVYTRDGDANLDKQVNVQDVTAIVSYILRDEENMAVPFGWGEADVNVNMEVEIADVTGIVNIIRDQPITKAGTFRAETDIPVRVELDADNFLTLSSQVPLAGIYLELTGAAEELPLVGEAAKFLQAAHRNGDTLRIVGYSLDGRTIPSGTTRVLRMPAGVSLVGASFSDASATRLRAEGEGIVTSNAPVEAIERLDAVSNYPNPFRGSTTFRYQLAEPAHAVTIHVFSANGALAAILRGLPGEVGENQHIATLTLPAGVYYYRLTAKGDQGVKASNSNILIIK